MRRPRRSKPAGLRWTPGGPPRPLGPLTWRERPPPPSRRRRAQGLGEGQSGARGETAARLQTTTRALLPQQTGCPWMLGPRPRPWRACELARAQPSLSASSTRRQAHPHPQRRSPPRRPHLMRMPVCLRRALGPAPRWRRTASASGWFGASKGQCHSLRPLPAHSCALARACTRWNAQARRDWPLTHGRMASMPCSAGSASSLATRPAKSSSAMDMPDKGPRASAGPYRAAPSGQWGYSHTLVRRFA